MEPQLQLQPSKGLLNYTQSFLDGFTFVHIPLPMTKYTVLHHESVTTVLLHRGLVNEVNYQTELIMLHPRAEEWPGEHRHPHVNSIEIGLYDASMLTRFGVIQEKGDFSYKGLQCLYLDHTCYHGFVQKRFGAVALSCQEWLDIEPTSVGLDWEGQPVSEGHKRQQTEYFFVCPHCAGQALLGTKHTGFYECPKCNRTFTEAFLRHKTNLQ
jgi:hypothetical protein